MCMHIRKLEAGGADIYSLPIRTYAESQARKNCERTAGIGVRINRSRHKAYINQSNAVHLKAEPRRDDRQARIDGGPGTNLVSLLLAFTHISHCST